MERSALCADRRDALARLHNDRVDTITGCGPPLDPGHPAAHGASARFEVHAPGRPALWLHPATVTDAPRRPA